MGYSPERIRQSIIPDLRDNIPADKAPRKVRQELGPFGNAYALTERLLPQHMREELLEKSENLPEGYTYAILRAGSKEKGTLHMHSYAIRKEGAERSFFFLDPEHVMGNSRKKGQLPKIANIRPKVNNLLAFKLGAADTTPTVSFIRFRTEAVSGTPEAFTLEGQLEIAEAMLASGAVPKILEGHENEIVFRVDVRPEAAEVESRYASEEDLKGFIAGGVPSEMLKGRVRTQRTLGEKILKHLNNDKFRPIGEIERPEEDTLRDPAY